MPKRQTKDTPPETEPLKTQLARALQQASDARAERDEALKRVEAYERKAEDAEKASRMKSLFLANMSHEIRTPLNAIEGFARLIAETDSAEERMKFLEIIESNNNRLQQLINDILDLSRVEAGEISINKSPVDLRELCANIRQLFKFRCPSQIDMRIEADDTNIVFVTDANRLTQVISNLIGNALKHTTRGSISYGYKLTPDHNNIIFHVTDTGSGIEPEIIGNIFKTYVSKDAQTHQGYGLGLPLSKIIVEKLGGHITVESTLGEGSTFSFILPFEGNYGGMAAGKQPHPTTRAIIGGPIDEDQLKLVLVAEDERYNYELVKNVLKNRYRTIWAKNGIEAVELNEAQKPDLILMDIRMPEMNGLDATRVIKEVNATVPIIALSAFAFDESMRQARQAGCDDFIAKPFRMETLIDTIDRLLKKPGNEMKTD